MKINPLNQTLGIPNRVREKDDAGDRSRGDHPSDQRNQQGSDQGEQGPPEHFEISDTQVAAAIESFSNDNQALANGLKASASGSGPGLKVVLKDGSGAIVRQLTGEEFIRLREAASKDGRIRGKILDQKL